MIFTGPMQPLTEDVNLLLTSSVVAYTEHGDVADRTTIPADGRPVFPMEKDPRDFGLDVLDADFSD